LYRCSGCGRLVDDRNPDEVRIHRSHAFDPQSTGLPRQHQTRPASPGSD
jgi:hypothetical protein